jgi:hypothetical protein
MSVIGDTMLSLEGLCDAQTKRIDQGGNNMDGRVVLRSTFDGRCYAVSLILALSIV